MKVRISNPELAPGLIDPITKRSPFIDPETGSVIVGDVEVPETSHWVRRVIDGDIKRADQPEPTGNEPVVPLTTRGSRR